MVKYVKDNDPDVYGCCINVDTEAHKDSIASTLRLPALEYGARRYKWLKESQRSDAISRGFNVIDVKFSAGFHFIKREIKNKIKYTTIPHQTDERPIWERKGGYACDLALSHWLDHYKIPIKLDLRHKIKHLRYCGDLLVGKKEENLEFFKYRGGKLSSCHFLQTDQ